MLAEGVGAWVRIHVKDWVELRQPGAVKPEYIDSGFMLEMPTPKGVCNGFSVMTRDLARSVGLDCDNIIGVFKNPGVLSGTERDNHEWNCFVFEGGVRALMDTSQTRVSREQVIQAQGKMYRDWVMPKTPAELDSFLSTRFGRKSRDQFDVESMGFNGVNYRDWATTDSTDRKALFDFLRRAESRFNRSHR